MELDLKRIKEIFQTTQNKSETAKIYCKEKGVKFTGTRRRYISEAIRKDKAPVAQTVSSKSETSDNNYTEKFFLSAWDRKTGKILDIETYCERYNLPFNKLKSFKFLPHHYREPSYNVVFDEDRITGDVGIDYDAVKEILEKEITKDYTPIKHKAMDKGEGVLKIADLHLGALITGLIKTRDYNTDILRERLAEAVSDFNLIPFKSKHIHIQGDLIESFSGLNHINSWQSMDKDVIGATAIKMCSKMLHEAFKDVKNLKTIKITGGNHDRLSKNNDEDVKAGAAEIIAYCLELMGYDVEFHPYIITHKVEGVNWINLHGDKKLSGKTTEEIVSDYGEPGMYNFVTEAHLHTAIEKLTAKQINKFNLIKTDKLMMRRMVLKPFFTGNYYSETLGYNTNAGYTIFWANKHGLPKMLDNTI